MAGTVSSCQELRAALADRLQEKGNLSATTKGTESGQHLTGLGSEFFLQPPDESLTG